MQKIWGLLLLSSLCIPLHSESPQKLQRDLDKRLKAMRREVRCIPQFFSGMVSQWFEKTDDLEKRLVYTDVLCLIEDLVDQYDENRPEPNFFKLVLEKVSWGHYQRPTGSLTPKAFKVLQDWLSEHPDEDIRLLYATVLAELKSAHGTRKKALLIIMSKVRFELDRRDEDNDEE